MVDVVIMSGGYIPGSHIKQQQLKLTSFLPSVPFLFCRHLEQKGTYFHTRYWLTEVRIIQKECDSTCDNKWQQLLKEGSWYWILVFQQLLFDYKSWKTAFGRKHNTESTLGRLLAHMEHRWYFLSPSFCQCLLSHQYFKKHPVPRSWKSIEKNIYFYSNHIFTSTHQCLLFE